MIKSGAANGLHLRKIGPVITVLVFAIVSSREGALAQSSAITYQGSLDSGGAPASGNFDFAFTLFDARTNGNQIAGVTNLLVPVTNGLFTTSMDFGSNAYTGGIRWLNIAVRTSGSSGPFTPLLPRQQLTAAPVAVYALTGNPGPPGTNGTTGQGAITVYGTSSVTPAINAETLLPGLTQTVNVPSNCVIYLATDGGLFTTSTSTSGFSQVEVYLKIDGNVPSNGGYADISVVNNGGKTSAAGRWSISLATSLTPGSHTVAVYGYLSAGSTATLSGGQDMVGQGELTVMFLKL